MRESVLARPNPLGLRIHAESLAIAPLAALGRFEESEALGRRLLEEAAALRNSMVLSVAITTVTSSYLMNRPEPDGSAALAVFDAYEPLPSSPGSLMEIWMDVMRSLALAM